MHRQQRYLRLSRTRVLVCAAHGGGDATDSDYFEERLRTAASIRAVGIGADYVYPSFNSLSGLIDYCYDRGIAYLVILKRRSE